MAVFTFTAKFRDDGSFAVPVEAIETLGLQPGDPITVRIEAANDTPLSGEPDQAELQRRVILLFEEADRLVPEPGKPLTDPLEAAWGAGVEEKFRKMGFTL